MSEAEAFVSGHLSAVELHKLLSKRTKVIADEIEADLWALVFEVADGDIGIDEARRWLATKHRRAAPENPT